MKLLDHIALVVLFILLFITLYVLIDNLPGETEEFLEYKINGLESLSEKSFQFYANMRYQDRVISYYFDDGCSSERQDNFEKATKILEQRTILDFYKADNAQIFVSCSNIAPEPEQENHFIAGEGGPTEILNASKYAVMLSGKISLYRDENCEEPKIAVHELLHVLGFDHNNKEKSIMYPVTNCEQEIDEDIVNEINRLYTEPSFGDVLIENLNANKSGRYLNFNIVIANIGLRKIENSALNIKIENTIVKSFGMEELNIGAKKSLTVTNLRIPKNTKEIIFEVKNLEPELDKDNNKVGIGLIQHI